MINAVHGGWWGVQFEMDIDALQPTLKAKRNIYEIDAKVL